MPVPRRLEEDSYMNSDHDFAEIARSASEASKIKILDVDFTRYLSPPRTRAFHWSTLSICLATCETSWSWTSVAGRVKRLYRSESGEPGSSASTFPRI